MDHAARAKKALEGLIYSPKSGSDAAGDVANGGASPAGAPADAALFSMLLESQVRCRAATTNGLSDHRKQRHCHFLAHTATHQHQKASAVHPLGVAMWTLMRIEAHVYGQDARDEGAPKARPWERSDLVRRLRSFRPATWFCKPAPAGPIECARRGWVNAGQDLLSCEVHIYTVVCGQVQQTQLGMSASAAVLHSSLHLHRPLLPLPPAQLHAA
jgi:C3HC zinc finger-like